MKKVNLKKPVKMTISYELPDGHTGLKFCQNELGEFKIIDQNGNEVVPLKSTRSTFFEKESKPKYQTVFHQDDGYLTIGGLSEISKLKSFFVIDTNTELIENKRVSISFLMRLKLIAVQDGYRVLPVDDSVFIFEFIGVPIGENPEMLAILKLANDILATESHAYDSPIWIVNDSELGDHQDISMQKKPIYSSHFLPKPFRIVYASSDTGSDAINQLFRIADGKAKEFLEKIKNKTFGGKQHINLKEDNRVLFTCHPIPLKKFEMGIIRESSGVLEEIQFS